MTQLIPPTPATVQNTTLEIVGMSCDGCARRVTTALNALEGVINVSVDLQKDRAIVEHLPAYSDALALVTAVRDAGYTARVAETVDDSAPSQSEARGGCCCGCGPSPRSQRSFDLGTSTIG